jgi:prevent-host-death family protein
MVMKMKSYSLADAKARLSELVELAAAGESVEITRRGKPVAQLVAAQQRRKPIDVAALRAVAEEMPKHKESTRKFIRRMREDSRF